MPSIRRTIMLRPMQTGVSGYARLQCEAGGTQVQLHARGLPPGQARLFWYLSDRAAREVAGGTVNPHGELSLEAEAPSDAVAPERLQALILLTGGAEPRPLLIGLCVEQSAGSLLDAKNAALALCERMRAKPEPAQPPPEPKPQPVPSPVRETIPREIFLPAIDPAPYLAAREEKPAAPKRNAPAADRLRPVRWPRGFESLAPYFDQALPCRLFDLPGWRFVYAAHAGGPDGLWLGCERLDGRIHQVAYAVRGQPPPGPGAYRAQKGLDGMVYQVLWQKV